MEEQDYPERKRAAVLAKVTKFPLRIITFLGQGKRGVLVMLILLISAVSGTIYLARTKPELLGIYTEGGEASEEVSEVERLVAEVGEIIALPDEIPTIATVTDAELTRQQPFFANAQNGDRVLIYSSAKKAFLYRPSEKKIIEVGVVNVEQQPSGLEQESTENIVLEEATPTPEPTETFSPTPTVAPTPFIIPTSRPTPTVIPTPTITF